MNRKVFIAGFPEAGKTTFLASLFHVLDEKRKHGKGYYVELPKDIFYINRIRDQWALVNPLERTRTLDLEELHFKIYKDNSVALELTVPDVSGELFLNILKDRKLETSISGRVVDADSVIFFIHPEKVVGTRRLDDIIADTGNNAEGEGQIVEQEFTYLDSPTQVLIVDLIQSFRKIKSSVKFGIIISAWDLVSDTHESPSDYVDKNLPLLSQFLGANDLNFVCGLSANGGDIFEDKERLVDMEPSDRVKFYAERKEHRGYDRLIEWLIND
ncbi:hypothetical protein ACES2I_17440 [Bdellovibrio bacteriovorus]|uniref:TRAFAC clade GTPase domain-containing protein n=1 Tax=Bdellovibrio bacteriovorus TaxID=959 RepID=UPI0035A73D85